MRNRVLLLALTSVLMSRGIPAIAQQPQSDSTVSLSQLTAEMIEKVRPYHYGMTHEEYRELQRKSIESEYIIEIEKISKKQGQDVKTKKTTPKRPIKYQMG